MSDGMHQEHFVGSWQLASFCISFSDNAPIVYPFGEHARGQLLYAADGQMSAILCPVDRAPLGVDTLERARSADEKKKAASFDSYMSYAGRWSLDGNVVTHHIEFALVPELVGHDHTRTASLDPEGALVLCYDRPTRRGATAGAALLRFLRHRLHRRASSSSRGTRRSTRRCRTRLP